MTKRKPFRSKYHAHLMSTVSYHTLWSAMTPMTREQWAYFGYFAQEMSRQIQEPIQ